MKGGREGEGGREGGGEIGERRKMEEGGGKKGRKEGKTTTLVTVTVWL